MFDLFRYLEDNKPVDGNAVDILLVSPVLTLDDELDSFAVQFYERIESCPLTYRYVFLEYVASAERDYLLQNYGAFYLIYLGV